MYTITPQFLKGIHMSTITTDSTKLDAIIALDRMGVLTRAAAEAILGHDGPVAHVPTIAPAPAQPKAVRKPARKRAAAKPQPPVVINGETEQEFTTRIATMAGKQSTKPQMKRINAKRAAASMRTYATVAAFRKDFPTMRSAAIEYRILSA